MWSEKVLVCFNLHSHTQERIQGGSYIITLRECYLIFFVLIYKFLQTIRNKSAKPTKLFIVVLMTFQC
jgi:hypothetical protein